LYAKIRREFLFIAKLTIAVKRNRKANTNKKDSIKRAHHIAVIIGIS
jgi:hypothetical protein